ncbi:hypothetical protein ACFX2G_041296 [Malus domestica]
MAPLPSLQLRQPTCQPLRQCTSRFQIWFSVGFGSVSNPMPISSFSCPLDHLSRSPPLRNSSIEEAAAMPLQEYVDRTRESLALQPLANSGRDPKSMDQAMELGTPIHTIVKMERGSSLPSLRRLCNIQFDMT